MHFQQEKAISTLSGGPLKLVDNFMYFSSSISSTESDVNILLAKAYGPVLIMLKSDQFDKIKRDFFQAVAVLIQLYMMVPHGY